MLEAEEGRPIARGDEGDSSFRSTGRSQVCIYGELCWHGIDFGDCLGFCLV
jgi:hypothetical protein